ncbi:CD209 antigen-like protein E [Uranotaenia lowii]|uniref:CD209 antigen-like protein E n=1 Tax=Uranotaenia lowii TaxID=190385 RepID=UPI00247A1497|nr:CD209 antigen-like protein E [Uranotaenia lowii]
MVELVAHSFDRKKMKNIISLLFLLVLHLTFGAKYYVPNLRANWHKAHEFCTSLGMALVSVESNEKHQDLIGFIQTTDKLSNLTRYWLGASDLAEPKTFTWLHNSRQLTFQNWARSEPNNLEGEHCVEMLYQRYAKYTWGWNDNDCTFAAYPICETVTKDCVDTF